MAQERKIKFASIATIEAATGTLRIKSFHRDNYPENTSTVSDFEQEPDTFSAELPVEVKYQDSVKAMEGELIVSLDAETTDYVIDVDGDLLVLHDKSHRYSLNNMGELEYTFN